MAKKKKAAEKGAEPRAATKKPLAAAARTETDTPKRAEGERDKREEAKEEEAREVEEEEADEVQEDDEAGEVMREVALKLGAKHSRVAAVDSTSDSDDDSDDEATVAGETAFVDAADDVLAPAMASMQLHGEEEKRMRSHEAEKTVGKERRSDVVVDDEESDLDYGDVGDDDDEPKEDPETGADVASLRKAIAALTPQQAFVELLRVRRLRLLLCGGSLRTGASPESKAAIAGASVPASANGAVNVVA